MPCAFVLHLAFPRANLPWLAPLAFAGLFAAWMTLPPRSAALVGYLAGLVFFSLNFSWFGETAGALLGPFGFILDLGPSAVEAVAFALAAAVTALAAERLRGVWLAVVAAAAFTLAELLRSSGLLGVPLYQIGAAFVDTPLAPLAAFGGVYLLTFVVALAGAVIGAAAVASNRRGTVLRAAAVLLGIGVATTLAWADWPARWSAAPTLRAAAVQGNIRQSVKWDAASLPRAVARYTELSTRLQRFKPAFVLWPETVITTELRIDPATAKLPENAVLAATGAELRRRFGKLATDLGAVVAVGSDETSGDVAYNDLYFFQPGGGRETVYRKRQLVPFAEFLPGRRWLLTLPFASLVSNFGAGDDGAPIDARLRVAPLICWEAGFTDLAQTQAAAGARFFAVATDDAWFGDSDGPYAQAQLTQLRAIETGRWVLRAAATGISGIVAPDGRWVVRTALDTQDVVTGTIGDPRPTVYSRLGPWPIGLALALLAAAPLAISRRRRTR